MSQISFDKNKIKIALFEGVHQSAVELIKRDGYENIHYFEKSLPKEELFKVLEDTHFIGIRSRTQITEEVLAAAPKLAGIGCFCIGTNQVDLEATQKRGIPVFNAPFANTRSVAELVLAEIIMLSRGVPEKNAAAHRGGWLKTAHGSHEVRGKTLGIVGYGHIGSQLGILAEGLGMQVIFYDVDNKLTLGNTRQVLELGDLLQQSDFVSFHVPQTEQTNKMFSAKEIALCKPGVSVINASRGTVIDIDALSKALESGHVKNAAIDVFPSEPKSNQDEFESPLRAFDNVILTPHIGGSTQEAQLNIGIEVAEKMVKYSNNGSTLSAVNFPEVSLPELHESHRICHIHRNEPGVLMAINKIFSENDINISSQYLQTTKDIGYVVTDVNRSSSQVAFEKMLNIPATIRARILY
jgi:D-3-phosphoglycerate dehydrogenase / 2-oxoglutarate reductase